MPALIDNLDDLLLKEAAQRASNRQQQITKNLSLIKKGRGHEAESKERLDKYEQRQKSLAAEGELLAKALIENANASPTIAEEGKLDTQEFGLERLVGTSNDLLSIEFLEAGLLAARSVGRIIGFGTEFGTGFHVGHGILLTNHHIFHEPASAAEFTFELNVEANKYPPAKEEFGFDFNPDRFFLTDKKLDFTLVALDGHEPIERFGWHVLIKDEGKIRIGDPVNIIQHAGGGNKQIVVHNSYFVDLENGSDVDPFCWYSGDTFKGSSGSPVFNNRWEVIALHHKAVPKTNKNGEIVDVNGHRMSEKRLKEKPEEVAWYANEGVRTSRLVKFIEEATFDKVEHTEIRDSLLALWSGRRAHERGLKAT